MKTKNLIQTTILLAAIIFFALACEREWNNPWDEKLNPQDWAPTNLEIEVNSITSVTLNWQDNSTREEGFKIERKYESGTWEEITTTTTNNYKDNNFELNTQVYYRICAYVGSYISSFAENNFDATIPPPTNLIIEANSVTSVTLTWEYNQTGHEGFKIDRKINQGEWVVEFSTVNASQTNFTDDGVDLENNDYTYRVYAFLQNYNSQKIEKLIDFACGITSLVDDRDGQQYETVKIGDQCWMKENLNYETSNSWCYDNNSSNCDVYGRLYAWDVSLNACPDGWHLPTDDELCILEQEVDTTITCNGIGWRGVNGGTKLKQGGSSGFEALLAGSRGTCGSFVNLGSIAYFWTSSEYSGTSAWSRTLSVSYATVNRSSYNKAYGCSVRCIKDY